MSVSGRFYRSGWHWTAKCHKRYVARTNNFHHPDWCRIQVLQCLTHRFIGDTTLSEILRRGHSSGMDEVVEELVKWTEANNMKLNCKKTKEIVLGSAAEGSTTPACCGQPRCRTSDFFQTIGHTHLLQLEMGCPHRFHMCKSCFQTALPQSYEESMSEHGRLVLLLHDRHTFSLEYACPVWHSSLTKKLNNQLESQQVRALRIIFGDKSYTKRLWTSLVCRHSRISGNPLLGKCSCLFFTRINCLNKLLPDRRNQDSISKLRVASSQILYNYNNIKNNKTALLLLLPIYNTS